MQVLNLDLSHVIYMCIVLVVILCFYIPNFLANVLASPCGVGQGCLVVIDLLVDCLGGVVSSVSVVERRESDLYPQPQPCCDG